MLLMWILGCTTNPAQVLSLNSNNEPVMEALLLCFFR